MDLTGLTAKGMALSDLHLPTVAKKRPNGRSDWVGSRKEDPSPILYLSGTLETNNKNWEEKTFLTQTGCKYRCFSYAYCGVNSPMLAIRHAKALDLAIGLGVNVFLDSGAHTFHNWIYKSQGKGYGILTNKRRKLVEDLTEDYVIKYAEYMRWCSQTKRKFDFYATFDADRNCEVIWKCTKRLQDLGCHPAPVYHGDRPIDWVQRYIDAGHQIICVGMSRTGKPSRDAIRRYYDTVTNYCSIRGIKTHGFAVTADMFWEFDWHCMTDEHEILTKRGFLKRKDVKVGDFALSFVAGKSEWKRISKVHYFPHANAPVREYDGIRFRAAVTDNHKWLVGHVVGRQKNRFEWRWKTTKELNSRDLIPRCAKYQDAPVKERWSDDIVRLVAWVWTDGSVTRRRPGLTPEVVVYQSITANPPNVHKLRELLKRLNATSCESHSQDTSGGGGTTACLRVGNEAKVTVGSILGVPKQLRMDWIMQLSKRQLRIFVKTAILGDGCVRLLVDSQSAAFSQNEGPSLEAFRIACILAGYAINEEPGRCNKKNKSISFSAISFNHSYSVPYTVRRSESVWCVEVEDNHTFMTRYQGSYYWTGNSADSTTWLKAAAYGKILECRPERHRVSEIHVSSWYSHGTVYGKLENLAPSIEKYLRDTVEAKGFDWDKVRGDFYYRANYNAKVLVEELARRNTKPQILTPRWDSMLTV